jgi:hypothetical protein
MNLYQAIILALDDLGREAKKLVLGLKQNIQIHGKMLGLL